MIQGRTHRKHQPKIGIIGQFGWGNLGDETVVSVLIRKIRQYAPDAEIYGISCVPGDTVKRHGILAFPVRRSSEVSNRNDSDMQSARLATPVLSAIFVRVRDALRKLPNFYAILKELRKWTDFVVLVIAEFTFICRSFRRLKGFDLLIVPGSGPLTDYWGGPWNHSYMLLSWALLARLRGISVIALSIGAERLTTALGKRFCLGFLRLTKYCSFRDSGTKLNMKELGWKGDNPVYPDQAFGLAEFGRGSTVSRKRDRPIIGINPVSARTYGRSVQESQSHERYLRNMAESAWQLIAMGFCVHFCPSDAKQDSTAITTILRHMETIAFNSSSSQEWKENAIDKQILTVDEFIAAVSEVDVMIASRFHGALIPFVLLKPVVSLSYERKLDALMVTMDQGQYALDLRTFLAQELVSKIQDAFNRKHEISSALVSLVETQYELVSSQYDFVFTKVHPL